jgi:hypothetical protein
MRTARCLFCCLLILSVASVALAQGRDTGAIRGIITDPDGAALPGVTVTLSSEALLGGTRTATTTLAGIYRFPGLPPGTYELLVTLTGFRTVQVADIGVHVASTLTFDALLELAGVAETLTVTGEAPIIDLANSSSDFTWGEDQLQEIPSAMDVWSYIQQVPGMQTNRENVGGSGSVMLDAFEVHGSEREQQQYNINGMDMTLFEHGIGLGYYNTDAFEEIQFTTAGITAEYSKGGVIINAVVRDGGNDFHGMLQGMLENDSLQSSNIDDDLRKAGVTSSAGGVDYIKLATLNLGGPIKRDRAWFYTGGRSYAVFPIKLNCITPEGVPCTDGVTIKNVNAKITARPDDASTVMLYGERQWYDRPTRNVGQFVASEATWIEAYRYHALQAKYNRVFGNTGFLDAYIGYGNSPFPLNYQTGVGDTTTALDVVTGHRFGAASREFRSIAHLWTMGTNYTLFNDDMLGASHDLKFGVEHRRSSYYTRSSSNGALERQYADGVPFRVSVRNHPVEANSYQQVWMGYVQDDVRIGNLTLNLGVRVEKHNANIPEQKAQTGPWIGVFFSEQPPVEPQDGIAGWTTLSPRVGFAWDLMGTGQTVVKGSFGRYYFGIDNADIHSYGIRRVNANARVPWNDLNGNDFPDFPDEFNTTGIVELTSSRRMADDFRSPHADEFNLSIERELTRRSSLSARFTYRKNNNLWAQTWDGIPSSAWNIPSTAVDPITSSTVEYWSIDPAFVGADNVPTLTNQEDNYNRYHGVDFIYTRRFDGTWMVTASATISDKYGRIGGFSDRNTREIFPYGAHGLDTALHGRVSGYYVAPYDINLGFAYRYSGGRNVDGRANNMARTLLVADQTTGSFYNIRVEENGSFRQDATNILDLRLAKTFRVGNVDVEAMIDGFNALNANNILVEGTTTGGNLGTPIAVLPPRVFRIGARINF